MSDWFKDEDFWRSLEPFMFPESRYARALADSDELLALTGLSEGSAILDLCCGPGRHALELARRGHHVTGVDSTLYLLNKARNRAQEEGLRVEFVQQDMREFVRPGAFDAVVNLFTAFGYFEDPADDVRVVRQMRLSLRPGGVFVIDVIGKEIIASRFKERAWEELDGVMLLQEHRIEQNWSWMNARWILIEGTTRREFPVQHRIYSARELSELLTGAGFTSVAIYGSLAGIPYDHNAKRLVAVARNTTE